MDYKLRLKIYTYVDGINDIPFPNTGKQAQISAFSYNCQRMGSISLTATLYYPNCLDNEWTKKQYVSIDGEKYFIRQVASSSKDNSDARYKHDLEFLSERALLNDVYFFDVVTDDAANKDKYVSNSTKVTFIGDISEFVSRLNYSMKYSGLDYAVVIDNNISSDTKEVSFEDKYLYEAIQEIYNIYGLPFYWIGKICHVGYTNNEITTPFRYGQGSGLLSISKQNANYKIVNRCTGVGSSDNIPFYYPNPSNDRKAIEDAGGTWITPSQNLMPPIYRESKGSERFYNAINNIYKVPSTDEYYEFPNPFVEGSPKEQKVSFSEIRPTIKNTLNANGLRIDQILDIAFDDDDSDELDAEGNYIHSYFYIKLRKFDGEYSFNLFEQALESDVAKISLTSGNCSACTFEIGATKEQKDDKYIFYNPVQVDKNGNIVSGSYSDKVDPSNIQKRQQDTSKYEVWIALKKEIDTFGIVMPNASSNYKPSIGDSFVIIGILMPNSYIYRAENELKDSIIKYMSENNTEKFTFSIDFSRIYLDKHPLILGQLDENAKLLIEYNEQFHSLYITNYKYEVDESSVLPKITVELSDTLTIVQSSLQTKIDAVKEDIMNSFGSLDFLKQGLKYFIRKDVDDTAKGKITFEKGIILKELLKSDNFIDSLISGKGYGISKDGNAQLESLEIRDSMKVMELIINEISLMQGDYSFSDGGYIEQVEQIDDTTYRLYIRKKIDTDISTFEIGDILYSIINNLREGGKDYHTSWMRVLSSVNTENNSILVKLIESEKVPTGINYTPQAGFNVTRRGNVIIPAEGEMNEHSQSWLLSSREGRIMFLANVYKPILEDSNYALSIGKIPKLKALDHLPIEEGALGIVAQYGIFEHSWTFDYNGDVKTGIVDRGEWSIEIAQGDNPYRNISLDKLSDNGEHVYTLLEQHCVWHFGCKWGCLTDKTTEEPFWNASDWVLLEGNKNYSIEFYSDNGTSFRANNVNLNLTAKVLYASMDITDKLIAAKGSQFGWSRDTGNAPLDMAWKPTHYNDEPNIITISRKDMGSGWGTEYRSVKFICNVFIPDGEIMIENSIVAKI